MFAKNLQNIAPKLLTALFVTSLSFAPQVALADHDIGVATTITSPSTTAQKFTQSDSTLTISGNGDLQVSSGSGAVYTDPLQAFSNLQVVVNTNSSATGIKGNGISAISIDGSNALSTIELDAGIITTNQTSGAAISLTGAGGVTTISTAADATI